MKNINKLISLIIVTLSIITFTNCKKSVNEIPKSSSLSGVDSIQNIALPLGELLSKIVESSKDVPEGKVIVFDLDYKVNHDQFTLKNSEIIDKTSELELRQSQFFGREEKIETSWTYKVTCDAKKDWTETCVVSIWNGGQPCKDLVMKCMNQGGCTTICQQKLIYVPTEKLFIASPSPELFRNTNIN